MRRSLGRMSSSTSSASGMHGHRDGGGVDAALSLGLRHALDAVHAAFKLQAAVDIGAFYRKDDFLYTSQLRWGSR